MKKMKEGDPSSYSYPDMAMCGVVRRGMTRENMLKQNEHRSGFLLINQLIQQPRHTPHGAPRQSLRRGTVSSRMPSLVTMQMRRASPVYTSLSAAEMKTSFTNRMALSKVSGTCSTFCMFLKPT